MNQFLSPKTNKRTDKVGKGTHLALFLANILPSTAEASRIVHVLFWIL